MESKKINNRYFWFSVSVMFVGLFVLLSTPYVHKLTGLDKLDIGAATLPSGYAICGISLLIIFFDRLPETITALKGIKKP